MRKKETIFRYPSWPYLSSWVIGIMVLNSSISLASVPEEKSFMRQKKAALAGAGTYTIGNDEYICYDRKVSCTAWNADKVIRIDLYKDIKFHYGGFSLTFPQGRPTIVSDDNRFSISLGGYINYDMGGYIGPDKKRNGSDMAGWQGYLRRGRAIVMVRYKDLYLTVSPDIGRPLLPSHALYDANLRYRGFRNTVIAWGLVQPIETLYDSETSRDFTLAERPMVIDVFRNIAGGAPRVAVNVSHWSRAYFVSAAFTGQRVGKKYKDFQDGQVGGIFRFAFRPLIRRDTELHLGLSGTFAIHGKNRLYSIVSSEESHIFSSRAYLRTGRIQGVSSIWAIGPEFAFRWKRFLLQAEYYSFFLPRKATEGSSRPNLNFSGWYVGLNYIILGQPRSYNLEKAVFARPQGGYFNPATGDWGALEWSVRWSSLDLNRYTRRYDRYGSPMGIQGGIQNIVATGFNWYPSPHFRVMLDYNHIFATPSRNNYDNLYGRESDLLLSRLQITF